MKKKSVTCMTAALVLSMLSTSVVPWAAIEDHEGTWEKAGPSGAWEYRSSQGKAVAADWLFHQGRWYRFDADGNMLTGWYREPETGYWYYLWPDGGMAIGWAAVNGYWYYLDPSGRLVTDSVTPDGFRVNRDGVWVNEHGVGYPAPGASAAAGSGSTGSGSGGSGGSSHRGHSGGSSGTDSGSGDNSSTDDNSGSGDSGNTDSGSGSGDSGNTGGGSGSGDSGNTDGGSGSGDSGSADGGSGSGDSGNTGGGSGEETPEAKTLVVDSQTRLVDLGWSQYVTVAFAKGYSLDQCTLVIDGTDVTEAFTKVDDDGTIAKWEITDLNPAKLTVTSGEDSQEVTLSENPAPAAPRVLEKTAPEAFLAHGSVFVWDYHLTNYDEDGNARKLPGRTTFDLGQEQEGILFYSPDAELKEDKSSIYGVGGEAVVMFNYTTEADKQWFDQISNVVLVSGNGYNKTLNDNLTWHKETAEHYGNTVGQLVVPLGQSNFYSNGRYYLRVTSGGKNTLFPVHVVNGTAPSMKLSEAGALVSGKDIHFAVENMTVGAEDPIYRVELTGPDGVTRELEKTTDWFFFGSSFVLYNDTNNNIPEDGSYTITVCATGFKEMSCTFVVRNSVPEAEEDLYGIDALSGATSSGGGSGSGDASDGGSTTMTADLMFDADLLANALLLDQLGVENEAASGIAERWLYDMSGYDAVIGGDGTAYYDYTDYYHAVQQAKADGDYLSFAEYVASGAAETTENRPYAVKYVLEDNLLGETCMNGSWIGRQAPALTLADAEGNTLTEVTEGTDVRLTCDDAAYLETVASDGVILLNGETSQNVDRSLYRYENGALVLDSSLFSADAANQITIRLDGYQENTVTVEVEKDVKTVVLEAGGGLKTGQEVTVTNTADETGDIFTQLQSVVLTRPDGTEKTLYPDGQESVFEKIGYTVEGNVLTLGKDLFASGGKYTLTVSAKYYQTKTVTFEITAEETGGGDIGGEELEPPEVTAAKKTWDNDYQLIFGMGNDDWMNAISDVKVNEATYEKGYVWNNSNYSFSATDGILKLGSAAFTESVNTVTISADGYADLILLLDSDGKIVTAEDELSAASLEESIEEDLSDIEEETEETAEEDKVSGTADGTGEEPVPGTPLLPEEEKTPAEEEVLTEEEETPAKEELPAEEEETPAEEEIPAEEELPAEEEETPAEEEIPAEEELPAEEEETPAEEEIPAEEELPAEEEETPAEEP